MPLTCEFELSNRNGVYFSGDTITGRVILTTTSLIGIKDIHLLFKGEAKVNYDLSERVPGDRYVNTTVNYRGRKIFVEADTILSEENILTPGSHRYNLEKLLPLKCPTSCEGRFGHVRYELTLQLRRTAYDDYFIKPITVISTIDLNSNPILKIPVEAERVLTSCSMFYCNSNIKSALMLPYSGYVSGQRIPYCIRVENQTNHDVRGYTLQFIRTMTFTATTPIKKTKLVRKVLFKDNVASICCRRSTRIYNGAVPIDATAPSTEGDAIIGVHYSLNAQLKLSEGITINPNKELKLNVVIGTVPIRENCSEILNTATAESNTIIAVTHTAPTAPSVSTIPTVPTAHTALIAPTAPNELEVNENLLDLPPSYKELGPPTFEEAIRSYSPFIDMDRASPHRHINFIPMYPMYLQNDE